MANEEARERSRKRRGASVVTPKPQYATKMLEHSSGRRPSSDHSSPVTIYCDVCDADISRSTRYHCTMCDNYDLCETCERRNDQLIVERKQPLHNPDHVVLKYPARF